MTRAFIVDILIWILYFGPKSYRDPGETGTWDPFLGRPDNFSGPKANFEIKTSWIAAKFQAHKPVNFASLTDSFIMSFSKLLKLWSWMQTRQTWNSFLQTGPCCEKCFSQYSGFPRSSKTNVSKFKFDLKRETLFVRNVFFLFHVLVKQKSTRVVTLCKW